MNDEKMTECTTTVLGQSVTSTTCVQLDTLIMFTMILVAVALVEAGALVWLGLQVRSIRRTGSVTLKPEALPRNPQPRPSLS